MHFHSPATKSERKREKEIEEKNYIQCRARSDTRKKTRSSNRSSKFRHGRMAPNVAALCRTAAASSNGRRCCTSLRCSFGCAFCCLFPAGALFGTGRTSFLLESFRLESSMASVADCWRLNQHSEKQKRNKTRWLDRSK